jgi:hypothetical protein
MAKINFTNQAVAAAYEPCTDSDEKVLTKSYSGLLSNITEAAAAEMVADKSGYLKPKKLKPAETATTDK